MNDPPQQSTICGLLLLLLVLCWLTVGARVYVRKFMLRNFGIDDLLTLVSLFFFSILISFAVVAIRLGAGQHAKDLSPEHVKLILKIFYALEILYCANTVTLKIAIAILLLRLAQQNLARRIILWTTYFYSLCGIPFLLVAALQCLPIRFYWDRSIQGACISRSLFIGLVYTNAAISFVTDGIFALLPTFLIWNTQMEGRVKIYVGFVLGLGISTSGVNIARFNFIGGLGQPEDLTFNLLPISILSLLEIGIGIIAASLAILRPLLKIAGRQIRKLQSVPTFSSSKFSKKTAISLDREPQPPAENRVQTSTPQVDLEDWCNICIASHAKAAMENQHLRELVNSCRRGEDGDSCYHISEDIHLPAMLRHESNDRI